MSVLIAAVPLFDNTMAVHAYRLCDHNPEMSLDIRDDFSGRSQMHYMPGLEIVQRIGLAAFSGDKPLFVNITRFHILTGSFSDRNIAHDKLILVLPAGTLVDDLFLVGLEALKRLGYQVAIDGYPSAGIMSRILSLADYIILDSFDKKFPVRFTEVRQKLRNIKMVVSNVKDMASYKKYTAYKGVLCMGSFYNNPVTEEDAEISPLKINALQLLKRINEDDFELANITKIVERDPALSISLLRFINSPAVGLRSKVSSISNAVAILGQKTIQRWATIAISVDLAQDKPGEITRLSLVRAKFAENMASLFEMGVFQNSLFMTGLFSMLDLILKKPMGEAVSEVAVDALVSEALVNHSGSLYRVLEFIYAYERADWIRVSTLAIQNNIKADYIGQTFIDALVWYHQLLTSIDEDSEPS